MKNKKERKLKNLKEFYENKSEPENPKEELESPDEETEKEEETEIIVLDKVLNMKEILRDSENNIEFLESPNKTEFIILDKILEKKDAQRQLILQQNRAIKEFYKQILEAIANGIWVCDKNDVIYYANKAMAAISGSPRDQIVGLKVLENFPEKERKNFESYYKKAKKNLKSVYFDEISILTIADRKSYQSGWLIPIVTDGNFDGMVCTVEDVTEHKKAEDKLKEAYQKLELAARTDPLTELLNRRGMLERMEIEQIRFERNKKPFALIIGDIDHFKDFNDTYGHNVGDFVLKSVAKTIRSMTRKQDVVARWGGEEFLLIFPETDFEGAKVITEKIRKKIENTTFEYKKLELSITLTFGATVYNQYADIDEAIKKADLALYEGKERGRNCSVFKKIER